MSFLSPTLRVELRAMIQLALPLMAGQILVFGTNVVDTLLAGHLSADVLGAVAIGVSIWMLPFMAMQGLMFAVPALVSQLIGAQQRDSVGALFRQVLFLALTVGLLALIGLQFLAAPITALLGVAPNMAQGVVDFLRGIAWGGPALCVFMASRGLSDGLSLTKPAMAFGLLGLLLLAPIGYVFMYGGLGLIGMGAGGSGLATALVIWLQAIVFLIYIARARGYRGIGWGGGRLGPDRTAILSLLRLGAPMAASVVMEVSMFSTAAFAIARFGVIPVAAHQIALNVAGLCFMAPLGLSGAITVRVGMALGAGDHSRARQAGLLGIGLAGVMQSLSCTLMITLPWQIAALYTHDPDVQAATVALLALAAIFQLSDGVQVAANGALRGVQDTSIPAIITLLAYWGVGLPIGLLLAFSYGMAARGMWIGLLAGLSAAAVLLTWRFLRHTLTAVQHNSRLSS